MREPRLDEQALLRDLEERAFAPSQGPSRVGIELELLAARRRAAVPLADLLNAIQPLIDLGELADVTEEGHPRCFAYGSIRLTFEPGGQVEIITPPQPSLPLALEDLAKVEQLLERVLVWRGIQLVGCGMNPWQRAEDVALQTPIPRYQAMQAYFSQIGPDGLRMMRLCCALQINVDAGSGGTVERRWRLANLMSPLLGAMFANSPMASGARAAKSARSLVWEGVDPGRTGLVLGSSGPSDYLRFALGAGVLLQRGPGDYRTGRPGFTFGDWLRQGDDLGFPSLDDWHYHLTTLFPQVRPRGFFELRSIDTPPRRWRGVPVAVATALLVDDAAREEAIRTLEPRSAELDRLAVASAADTLGDPAMLRLAQRLMSLALEGLARLPADFTSPQLVADTEAFCDRYTIRGRCPADDWFDGEPLPSGPGP